MASASALSKVIFTTFGMFIVDDIEWHGQNAREPTYNLIGGAGTYAILGARLVSGYELSKSISWIVDVGTDFPQSAETAINTWGTNCIYRHDLSRKTTRARNDYGENGFRAFRYLTPKRRLEVSSFSPSQIMSDGFHLVCSPERCASIVDNLRNARLQIDRDAGEPIIIWEPIPDLCVPDELGNLQQAAKNCTVISPNSDELRMFFAESNGVTQATMVSNMMGWTQILPSAQADITADSEYEHTIPPIPIIREGERGSTAYLPTDTSDHLESDLISLHVNAYHTASSSHQVTDPTGGGNTYLGALGMSLTGAVNSFQITEVIDRQFALQNHLESQSGTKNHQVTVLQLWVKKLLVAMIHATIAASFAIEQHGVPALSNDFDKVTNFEKWNGETFLKRLEEYIERENANIKAQLLLADQKLRTLER